MSATKRSRRRHQSEAKAASPPALPPASKRLKTTKNSHVPALTGLGFLVDDDARHAKKLEARLTNGVPGSKATRVDESHAVVAPDMNEIKAADESGSSQENAIGISSGESSSEDSDDEEDDDQVRKDDTAVSSTSDTPLHLQNGHRHSSGYDEEHGNANRYGEKEVEMAEDAEADDLEEPSFGEMLRARHPDAIDVQSSLPNPMADRQALIPLSGERTLTAPSGTSLGTVLTQALKTNDKDLLESCFHTTDLPSIRSTIERLASYHVATLLQRLAERIHKRPGRTGNLLVWVQWSLIAHGGYLTGQPEVMKKLKSLSSVIRERADGLQPLLHLKGKLDMLSAQLELRRSIQAASRAAHADSDDENDEGVMYVEGQLDDWSDSEDDEGDVRLESKALGSATSQSKLPPPKSKPGIADSEDDSDGNDLNGIIQEADDETSEDENEDDLLDVEALETSNDEDDEPDSDEEGDSDSGSDEAEESDLSDDESDVSDAPPPLPTSLNRKR